jgi:hypothetical protein
VEPVDFLYSGATISYPSTEVSVMPFFIHLIGNFFLYVALPIFVIALILGGISDFVWKKQLRAKLAEFQKLEFSRHDPRTPTRN